MRNPVSRVLVINDEALVLKDLIKGLNSAAKALDNPLGVTFAGVTTAREALKAIEDDGDLQAVVVDDTLYTLANGKSSRRSLQMTALSLVQNAVNGATAQLPPEVQAQGVTVKKVSTNILMFISLFSDDDSYDGTFLSNYATINLVNPLARLPGVGQHRQAVKGSVGVDGLGQFRNSPVPPMHPIWAEGHSAKREWA